MESTVTIPFFFVCKIMKNMIILLTKRLQLVQKEDDNCHCTFEFVLLLMISCWISRMDCVGCHPLTWYQKIIVRIVATKSAVVQLLTNDQWKNEWLSYAKSSKKVITECRDLRDLSRFYLKKCGDLIAMKRS